MAQSKICVGLGWGDEGKGITTDFLCSREDPLSTIVVRFSGGQQCGHNVKIGDRSHVHSNYGSGTLRGVPSYFSEHCTIYPNTMFREKMYLYRYHIEPELYIHPLAKLTTPADVAYNKWREMRLNHGSCGLGVGATMTRNETTGYKLYAIDLLNKSTLKEKVNNIYEYYRGQIVRETGLDSDFFMKEYDTELHYFNHYSNELKFHIKSYDFLRDYNNLIFEGSQGVMLDMNHGIFPNVTYANTTSKNAIEISKKLNIKDIEIYYVTRCYQTRHGIGWMSGKDLMGEINNPDETNVLGEWQGEFRIKEIDYDLLNYAIAIDNIYSGGLSKNLVVTCLDQRPNFKFEYHKLVVNFNNIFNSFSPDSESLNLVDSEELLSTY